METGLDLASRETLLAIISEQQGVISELRQRVESLEARLSGGGPGTRSRGTNLPLGARSRRSRRRSRERSVSTASPGRGWNPPRK